MKDMMELRKNLIEDSLNNFRDIIKLFRHDMNRKFEEFIPNNEFAVLKILDKHNHQMVSQIANLLNVSNSHITSVSEKLINKGMAVRARSETDRRIVYLSITEDGKRMAAAMNALTQQYFQEKFAEFTEGEINMLNQLLRKLMG